MDLYFSPLACSMATRIAFYEAGYDANYLEVDPQTKRVQADGSDFFAVNPLGLVPTLRTDDGAILTENAAILQYVAERLPDSRIGAAPGMDRAKLQQWLCFIGTELHKGLFVPLRSKTAPGEAKAYTLEKGLSRLDYLDSYLEGREFLLDHFSVADAYLVTVINWTMATPPIELAKWPNIKALLRAHPRAAEHRKSAGRGVRVVQGRTGAAQGGGVTSSVGWAKARSAVPTTPPFPIAM
jgi:glutathione S-transferase